MEREPNTPPVIPFVSRHDIVTALSGAVAHLRAEKILAYPTETIYGLGGIATPEAVDALIRLKGRPEGKPFLLLISGREMLDALGLSVSDAAATLAMRHWPGPLTLVLRGGERSLPNRLRGPEGGVAVRWTPHDGVSRLINALGEPITSTSANRYKRATPETAAEIAGEWSSAIARGDVRVLDGGRLAPSAPSTVVDCTGARPRVIRPGAIPATVLRESVKDLIGDA